MKKHTFAFLTACFLFVCYPSILHAAPVINEFSSGESSDWIEIYNPDDNSYDLSAYKIRDLTENNKLDLSGTLSPKGFAVFEWSNKLNNGGDLIKLVLASDNSIIDQVSYGDQGGITAPSSGQSAGRKSDGGSEWVLFVSNSKEITNNSSSIFIPPSPTPSKTPTPTKSPTPTRIPTAPKTSTGISKTPTLSKSTTTIAGKIDSSTDQRNSDIESAKISRGERSASEFAQIKPIARTENKKDVKVLGARDETNFPYFIISGMLFLASGGVLFARKILKERGIL